ncbi:FAD binding domain-containing protein [Lichenifustis flavocetrariae]|uniref:Xanthine dehydrogenase family protein subunit M n=1 Tax=Lichenifustis flavocetrariae TaxID=2949735 RepID=A0AA41Z5M3_9HYPH|nr:xanthine dehydrogenase family protein subunit M [Lichenifustis flavocetrariae]MCW6510765.1 xanthine dehydrogenase family protein subunit M [Lichenifustis flavocetrariae]
MYAFTYQRPTSLDDAMAMLGDGDAKLLAGGHTLLPTMKQRLAAPSALIDLGALRDQLSGVTEEAGGVTIGAMTRHGEVAEDPIVKRVIPALAAMASVVGDPAVRSRGTMGGSVANNDPAADYPAACLALGATIRTTKRQIAAADYFTGLFETALEAGEIITAIHFPKPEKAGYEKFRNPASRYAMVGVFVAKTAEGVRVTVTGAGANGVFRAQDFEQALAANFSADAIKAVKMSPDGLNSDIHADAVYRAHLIGVMARRALDKANI